MYRCSPIEIRITNTCFSLKHCCIYGQIEVLCFNMVGHAQYTAGPQRINIYLGCYLLSRLPYGFLTGSLTKAQRWGIGAKRQRQPPLETVPLLGAAQVMPTKFDSPKTMATSFLPEAMACAQVINRSGRENNKTV